MKCSLDLFIYQEIIHETKPDIIIETGTGNAGTTHFLASICDFANSGRVISIDKENTNHKADLPSHKRITYITGLSTSENTTDQIKSLTNEDDKIMVILDSDHHKNHVLSELSVYSQLVTKDNYLIVEDTNLNHPNPTDFEGPMEAIEEFLKTNQDFIIDESKHKFYLTFNPNGYLKRIYNGDI